MSKPAAKTARKAALSGKKPTAYPIETNGSKWATENCKKASALTESEREALFKPGALRIYGRQVVCTGR